MGVQNVDRSPDRPRMSTLCIHAMQNVERAGPEAQKSTFCTQDVEKSPTGRRPRRFCAR
jgi:hypothetical protein